MKLHLSFIGASLVAALLVPGVCAAQSTGVEVIDMNPTPKPHVKNTPSPTPKASTDPNQLEGATALLHNALAYIGTPYHMGGSTPSTGFDCSGFTQFAFATVGIRIPRTADQQYNAGRPIVGDPLPGDLLFFQTYQYGPSHVAIYLGNGQFVNAIGKDVHVASFSSDYFRSRYLGARRFLPG
jgi:cell wall-associated NlpC family hydrolase